MNDFSDLQRNIEFLNHHLNKHPHAVLIERMDRYEELCTKLKNRPMDVGALLSSAGPLINRMAQDSSMGRMAEKMSAVTDVFNANSSHEGGDYERRALLDKRTALFAAIIEYAVKEISKWLSRSSRGSEVDDGFEDFAPSPTMVDFDEDHASVADPVTEVFGDALANRLRSIIKTQESDDVYKTDSMPSPEKLLEAVSKMV